MTWTDRYMITSLRGTVYSRSMTYRAALRVVGRGNGAAVRALLDDVAFMTSCSGMTPSAVGHRMFARIAASGDWQLPPL